MGEALEIRIEKAWLSLNNGHPKTLREVLLTPSLRIVGTNPRDAIPKFSRIVGTFTSAVTLIDFRDAVFTVYDEMHGDIA